MSDRRATPTSGAVLAGVVAGVLAGVLAIGAPASRASGALTGVAAQRASSRAHRLVVPPAARTMPPSWHERFVIGYGSGRELLGTSPGGDSGSLQLGPDYGAPGPDGSWWFLDAAKARVAHYDAAGHYLGQVKVRHLLVHGQYFQWQLPHVMADGTLVATRFAPQGTMLLRVRGGTADEIAVQGLPRGRYFAPWYDDGRLLYGSARRGHLETVDPVTGVMRHTQTLATPSGTPFRIAVGQALQVDLPRSGVSERLPLRTRSGAPATVGVQVRAGTDDVLHLFLVGAGADHPRRQLAGTTQVGPSGRVAPVVAVSNPFSDADTGSPAQLAMAPGSSTPMLVYVLPDGVHVYEWAG